MKDKKPLIGISVGDPAGIGPEITAKALALAGEVDATVTGPISKEAINLAGFQYAGHTEIYADFTHTKDYAMLLVHDRFRVIHVSTHASARGLRTGEEGPPWRSFANRRTALRSLKFVRRRTFACRASVKTAWFFGKVTSRAAP